MKKNLKQLKATLIGTTAILIWSTLALFTEFSGAIPPFQLTAMAFSIAFLIGVGLWWQQGGSILKHLTLPKQVWATGIFGLFGYHFFYFMALKNAPTIEASLISYLWPLLIVLFSALLPNEQLRWFHILWTLVGFLGVGLLISGGKTLTFNWQYSFGYLAALISALTWSSYSVLSRYFGNIPTNAVGGFCGVTAILALVCHFLFEQTILPTSKEWVAIICLGLGPVGLAFFTWDYGVKHGNIKVLGAASYAAPLLSTLLLIIFGITQSSWLVAVACLCIVGGAVLASGDFFYGQNTTTKP